MLATAPRSLTPPTPSEATPDDFAHCEDFSFGLVTVTPEEAARLLAETNANNRTLNPDKVNTHARDMMSGAWFPNGAPIRFAGWFVTMLDAQHRLTGVVESGVTQTFLAVVNLPLEAQMTMDQDMAVRTFAHSLEFKKVKNARHVAAITRAVNHYAVTGEAVTGSQRYTASRSELFARLAANPGILDVPSRKLPPGFTNGMYGAFLYLSSLADEGDSACFDDLVMRGATPGSPVALLRDRLAREAASTTTHFPPRIRWALLVKTWNAWRAGVEIANLKFKPGGAKPEAMPTLDGISPEDVPTTPKETI